MPRLFDLIAVGAVAIVLLLPKASLDAKPALAGEKIELDRIAELEDQRFADPTNVTVAIDLAEAYLRLLHPDWALATLAQLGDSPDARVHLIRATAHAERLEAQAAVDDAQRGHAACDAANTATNLGCPEAMHVRLNVIAAPMEALLKEKIDPYQNPKQAADAVSKVLHSTKTNQLKPPTPKK